MLSHCIRVRSGVNLTALSVEYVCRIEKEGNKCNQEIKMIQNKQHIVFYLQVTMVTGV